jgi:hypothetical protein
MIIEPMKDWKGKGYRKWERKGVFEDWWQSQRGKS